MEKRRRSTGYHACNGLMHVGDNVRYDDGNFAFTTDITCRNGAAGFYFDDGFHSLKELMEWMDGDNFEIIKGEMTYEIQRDIRRSPRQRGEGVVVHH